MLWLEGNYMLSRAWLLVFAGVSLLHAVPIKKSNNNDEIIHFSPREIATQILQASGGQADETVLPASAWQDLQLESLMQKVDPLVLSASGYWGLRYQSRPVVGRQLENRIAVAQELHANTKLRLALRKELAGIAHHEGALLGFWDPTKQTDAESGELGHIDRANGLYYNRLLRGLNNNAVMLEAGVIVTHARDASLTMLSWGILRTLAASARAVSRRQVPDVRGTIRNIAHDNATYFSLRQRDIYRDVAYPGGVRFNLVQEHQELVAIEAEGLADLYVVGESRITDAQYNERFAERSRRSEGLRARRDNFNSFLCGADDHVGVARMREESRVLIDTRREARALEQVPPSLVTTLLDGMEPLAVGLDTFAATNNRLFTLNECYDVLRSEDQRFGPWQAGGIVALRAFLPSLPALYLTQKLVGRITSRETILRSLHNELVHVAQTLRHAQALVALVQENKALAQNEAFAQVHKFLVSKKGLDNRVSQLISLLQASTFTGSNPVLFSRGRVLLAHKMLKELKHELVPLLQAIGKIDGMVAIATYCREHVGKQATFVSPTLIADNGSPVVALQGCWLPLINAESAVVNNLSMGNNKARGIILTGPNGTGKSAIMKALAYSFVLAQAWGMVPAQQASMSVITNIETYIDPEEDVSKQLSTFMAQKVRADKIVARVNKASADARFIIVIDEPFSGTVEQQAAGLAAELAHTLATDPRNLLVLATHFEAPTKLAVDDTNVANYQLQVDMDSTTGKLTRRFLLLEGSAIWWFDTSPAAKQKQRLYIENLC